jgi:hypothetical protein
MRTVKETEGVERMVLFSWSNRNRADVPLLEVDNTYALWQDD